MRHPRAWQTQATSPGGGGEPSRGTKTAGRSDRSVEGVKPECRVARREDAGARVMCARVPAFRARPSDRAGLAKSRPCAFSARHSPHWGKGKGDGQTPSPSKPGAAEAWPFDKSNMSFSV